MSETDQAIPQKDAYKVIISYRAVRQFTDQPISEESLLRILEAGRWAGSAKNIQPWHFIVLRDRKMIDRLSECGTYAQHMRSAPLAIVIVTELMRLGAFDAGRAAQNMMLAASTMGIGSAMATMHNEVCANSVLCIPDEKQIQIVVDFGYPAPPDPNRPKMAGGGRKPLEEIVHWDGW